MPWQEQVIERATEYYPAGQGELSNGMTEIPRWRRVVLTVPRQSGKTTLLVLVVLWRMLAHPGVPHIALNRFTLTSLPTLPLCLS